jgi:multicomponent Na+:H+ antiporter subunit F
MTVEAALVTLSGALGLLMLLAVLRALLGRTAPDRMVAVDTINTLAVAMLVAIGAAFSEIIYIDVAIVYAMLSFVTTVYVSKYLEGKE